MKEDLLLIEEYKQGNSYAFEMLYKKYASKMKGVAFRYVGDTYIAEDILQEAFIKVFTKISDFKAPGLFEAWLRKVVVNTAITYYHSLKKTEEHINQFGIFLENETTEVETEAGNTIYSLEEMMSAINTLPLGYKMVFNMYVIDQYSHKEIAESLKITEGTSKSQLYKAREFLKKELHTKKHIHHEQ
jgi:RNA polymerase sigma factor (sigma-70 family)